MDVGSPSHRETKWLRDRLRLSLRKLQPPRSDEASLLATAMVLRVFHSRLSRASMVKSCRRARGLNPFTLNSCPPHSSRSEAAASCRPRRTQWPQVLQTGWRLRYLWRSWAQLVHFCCEARFTHSVVAPEILDRYCQHDSPHQGGLSPPLAGG